MNSYPYLIYATGSLIAILGITILAWFSMDMTSIIRWIRRKNELSIEGRWGDVERHFEQAFKARRPFVWLYRRYLMPGNLTMQFALFLFKQGRSNEARGCVKSLALENGF